MASPTPEVFYLFNPSTGAPVTGAAGGVSFALYKDETGTNVSPQPTITEIGGGAYKFTPVFASPGVHGIVYLLTTGQLPAYTGRFMRSEDYTTDTIPIMQTTLTSVHDFQQGAWEIKKTGPDANKLIVYAQDGTTPLLKFALTDQSGNPTYLNPIKRVLTS